MPETITDARKSDDRPWTARVPFPQAGEGAFFSYPLSSLVRLDEAMAKIMPDAMARGFTSFALAESLLLAGSPAAVRAAIDTGLKREGPDGKPVPFDTIDPDEIEWPLGDIVKPALEAICIAHHGKPYSAMIEEARRAAEEANRAQEVQAATAS
jgi:hypothetical protein